MLKKKLNHFVSEADLFLSKFDRLHRARSKNQEAELEKAARISALRDHKNPDDTSPFSVEVSS